MAAAWDLVREHGLAGLSMRDLGDRVGMRAQSVYSYFASKLEIYDAMFLEGFQAFAERMDEAVDDDRLASEPVATAKGVARAFVEFCTSDPARYQLLFLRTIPGFAPSAASYAVSEQSYERMAEELAIVGVSGQAWLDIWTAMLTGLASQQISNDPGGDRWKQLVDPVVEMLLREAGTRDTTDTAPETGTGTGTAPTTTTSTDNNGVVEPDSANPNESEQP